MNSLRKWLNKPKKTDTTLLAQFYFSDEDLNTVAAELDSFDGRKDPERCTMLVNQLRVCQDKVLTVIQKIMDEAIPGQRANRDFRVKFPDDVLQDSLAGQLWFGAECLAAGSSILNREVESASMRPLARALTKNLESLRGILRDQCYRSCTEYTDRIKEALIIFDKLFAEFELSYVSAMVPVKTMKEYDLLQEVTVLFSETVQRALKESLLTQDMIDYCDPALMFTIPRLAIVCGLLIFPEGPLNPDLEPTNMSEMYRPFQTLLQKIRELLYTLSPSELAMLEKSLCSSEDPGVSTSVAVGNQSETLLQIDQGFHEDGEGIVALESIGSNILVHSASSGSPVTPVNLHPEVLGFGQLSPSSTIVNELSESEMEDGFLNKSDSQDSGLQSEIVSTSETDLPGGPPLMSHDEDITSHCTDSQPQTTVEVLEEAVVGKARVQEKKKKMKCKRRPSSPLMSHDEDSTFQCTDSHTDETSQNSVNVTKDIEVAKTRIQEIKSKRSPSLSLLSHDEDSTSQCTDSHTEKTSQKTVEVQGETVFNKTKVQGIKSKRSPSAPLPSHNEDSNSQYTDLHTDETSQNSVKINNLKDIAVAKTRVQGSKNKRSPSAPLSSHNEDSTSQCTDSHTEKSSQNSVKILKDIAVAQTREQEFKSKSMISENENVCDIDDCCEKFEKNTGLTVQQFCMKSHSNTDNDTVQHLCREIVNGVVNNAVHYSELACDIKTDDAEPVILTSVSDNVSEETDQDDLKEDDAAQSISNLPGVSRQFSWQYNVQFALPQLSLTDHDSVDRQSSGSFSSDSTISEETGQEASVTDFVIETLANMNVTPETSSNQNDQTVRSSDFLPSRRCSSSKDSQWLPSNSHASSLNHKQTHDHQSSLMKAQASNEHQSTLVKPNKRPLKPKQGKRESLENISCGIGAQAQTSVEKGSEVTKTKGESKAVQTVKNEDTGSCSSEQCSDCDCGTQCSCLSETSSYNSETNDEEEIALAIQAAEVASRNEARSRFRSSSDLIHRLFVCIAGVADQLQTNYASDLRHVLKCVFEMNTDSLPEPDNELEQENIMVEPQNQLNDQGDRQQLPSNQRETQTPPSNSTPPSTNQTQTNHHTSQGRHRVPSSPRRIFDEPPKWVPDEEVRRCTACKSPFTFVRRRHHCRNCGKIFCNNCSSTTVPLPQFGHQTPVRVCHRCFLYQVSHFTQVSHDF